MGRDAKLDRLKILLDRLVFFCRHPQRVKYAYSHNAIIKNDSVNPLKYVDSRSEDVFFGLHLKTRGIQSLVVHESDRTGGSLWISEVKTFFLVFT